MKRKIILVLIAASVGLVACKALKKLTQFRVNYATSFTIPSSIVVNVPLDILTPEMQTNISQELENNNSNKDLIESVKLEEMRLTIASPAGQDFSFLKDVRLFISADGLAERQIAYKENIPENVGGEIVMDIIDEELKDYLKKDKITLRAKATTDKLITQNVNVNVANRFFVDAKILGL
jgi:hypothetical protein